MTKSVSKVLSKKMPRIKHDDEAEDQMEELKQQLAHLQQVAWMTGKRAVIVMEGFDAAGKGGCIRQMTEMLDPRGAKVIPVAAPNVEEKGQHYLQRFWKDMPSRGVLVIFDRSWYGRVLVEKVEGLAIPKRISEAYEEINQLEELLKNDGIKVIKIFLVVSKEEQLARFKARMEDPFKNWKITQEDVRNREKWDQYVKCADVMIEKCPDWHVIPSDDKKYARLEVLKAVVKELKPWMKDFRPQKGKLRMDGLAKELLK